MKKALNMKQKACVKKWLKSGSKEDDCPFQIYDPDYPHNICRSWFPKCVKKYDECPCPCHEYKMFTVIRRARQMLKGEK